MRNKEWTKESLLHSVLRGLIGFVLIEVLMIWLNNFFQTETDGFSMTVWGVLGVLNGFAFCALLYDKTVKVNVFRLWVGTGWVYLNWHLASLIFTLLMVAIMVAMATIYYVFRVDMDLIQGCNFCMMIIYGYDRSYRLKHIKELINGLSNTGH